MSSMVYSRHGGTLLIAERAADERAVQAALKDFDPSLRLTWENDVNTGRQVWNVHSVWSPDHPAVLIHTWRDSTTLAPLPLTMRIVDEVKRQRQVDTMKEIDNANARLKAAAGKESYDGILEVTEEFEKLGRTGRIHVAAKVGSQKLAQAKRRGREKGLAI